MFMVVLFFRSLNVPRFFDLLIYLGILWGNIFFLFERTSLSSISENVSFCWWFNGRNDSTSKQYADLQSAGVVSFRIFSFSIVINHLLFYFITSLKLCRVDNFSASYAKLEDLFQFTELNFCLELLLHWWKVWLMSNFPVGSSDS